MIWFGGYDPSFVRKFAGFEALSDDEITNTKGALRHRPGCARATGHPGVGPTAASTANRGTQPKNRRATQGCEPEGIAFGVTYDHKFLVNILVTYDHKFLVDCDIWVVCIVCMSALIATSI